MSIFYYYSVTYYDDNVYILHIQPLISNLLHNTYTHNTIYMYTHAYDLAIRNIILIYTIYTIYTYTYIRVYRLPLTISSQI